MKKILLAFYISLFCMQAYAAGDPFIGIKQDSQVFLDFATGWFAYACMIIALVAIGVMWQLQQFSWLRAVVVLLGGAVIGQAPSIASAITGYGG